MKKLFRIIALALTAVMLLAALAVPALAEDAAEATAETAERTLKLNTLPVLFTAIGLLVASALLIFIMVKLKDR